MTPAYVLLGDGGVADEVAQYLAAAVVHRAVTSAYLRPGLVDVAAPPAELRALEAIAAVGIPAVRRLLVGAWPGERYATVRAPGAWVAASALLGEGSVVAPGAVVTGGRLGRHALINPGATTAHDLDAGDFVTIGPGAAVGGHVRLGDGVFLGIGSVVRDRVALAEGVLVGAGAVVLHDVAEPYAVVVGNPARVIRVGSGWPDDI
jgi:acetyltransferase-like isoleucine patch superfamily enzyme